MKKFLLTLLLVGSAVFAADKKISQLPSLVEGSWVSGDQVPIVHSGSTYQTTVGDFDLRYFNLSSILPIANGGTGQNSSGAAFNALSPCTVTGGVPYASASNVNSCLAGNTTTTRKFLNQTGSGSASTAPGWGTLACSDLTNSVASCSTDATNASNISSGTLPAARLPTPTPTTLGGVQSLASSSHLFFNQLNTSGVLSAVQPACSDLSGVAASCATDATNATNITSGTLVVAQGGSGRANATAYAPVLGGTTSTGAFQSASTGMSVVGSCLVSTGTSSSPTWQSCAGAGLNLPTRQIATSTGSTTGYMLICASCSATAAAVYQMSYTFTIAAGSFSGTAGATYTNNGVTFTLAQTFTTAATSIILTGASAPTTTGTLTFASGTHVGNPVYTAFTGGANTITVTVNTTIASSTFLFTTNTSGSIAVSAGSVVKTSGTGDAVITFTGIQPTATYTPTTGTNVLFLEVQGGGGAGGGGSSFCSAGGAGAACYGNVRIASPVASQYTIGAGGVGISGATGAAGSYSCFNAPTGAIYCAGPGLAGIGQAAGGNGNGSAGGAGGTCTGPFDYTVVGAHGGQGMIAASGIEMAGAGAGTPLGTGGQVVNGTQNGWPATGFGAGGGGGSSNNGGAVTGGTGSGGIEIFHEFAQ